MKQHCTSYNNRRDPETGIYQYADDNFLSRNAGYSWRNNEGDLDNLEQSNTTYVSKKDDTSSGHNHKEYHGLGLESCDLDAIIERSDAYRKYASSNHDPFAEYNHVESKNRGTNSPSDNSKRQVVSKAPLTSNTSTQLEEIKPRLRYRVSNILKVRKLPQDNIFQKVFSKPKEEIYFDKFTFEQVYKAAVFPLVSGLQTSLIPTLNSPFATNFTTNQNLPIIVHDFG